MKKIIKVDHVALIDGEIFLGRKFEDAFEIEKKLFYNLMSAREQDFTLITNVFDRKLDLKVKTYFVRFDADLQAQIDSEIYDVIKVDRDKKKQYMYLYLQKVGW